MKRKFTFVCLMVFFWVLTACQAAPVPPTLTATLPPTNTPAPTNTPQSTATTTPIPTATLVPEMGKPVSSEKWEVTLIGVSLLKRGVKDAKIGGEALPNPGNRFVAVGFKVKSLGAAVSVNTQQIMLLDADGQKRGAYYLGTADASQEIDPFSIGVERFMWMIGEEVDISVEKYIHMIFEIPETSVGKEIFFMYDDIPAIPFTVE